MAPKAGQEVGGLMLKSGFAELSLAGGNSTLLCPEAKSSAEIDATWERGLGACSVSLGQGFPPHCKDI